MEKEAAKVKGAEWEEEEAVEKEAAKAKEAQTEEERAVETNPEPSPDTRPKRCSCSRFRSYRTPRRPRTCRRPTNRCSRSEVCSTTSQMGTQKH
jgi:hypothetical protein